MARGCEFHLKGDRAAGRVFVQARGAYELREDLKARGYRFDAEEKAWRFDGTALQLTAEIEWAAGRGDAVVFVHARPLTPELLAALREQAAARAAAEAAA